MTAKTLAWVPVASLSASGLTLMLPCLVKITMMQILLRSRCMYCQLGATLAYASTGAFMRSSTALFQTTSVL